jgi:hypothetical protein
MYAPLGLYMRPMGPVCPLGTYLCPLGLFYASWGSSVHSPLRMGAPPLCMRTLGLSYAP